MKPISLLVTLLLFLFSCGSPEKYSLGESNELIRINQLGYYPQSIKEFVVVNLEANSFQVINDKQKIRYKGQLINDGNWEASGETVLKGDFTQLSKPGTYRIVLDSGEISFPFEIKPE